MPGAWGREAITMKSFLTTWMPILAQYRLPLLLAAVAFVGVGIVMTQPTAPVSQWVEEDYVRSLTMLPPHTLAVTTGKETKFHLDSAPMVSMTIDYHDSEYGSNGTHTQPLAAVSTNGQWWVIATTVEPSDSSSAITGTIDMWSLNALQHSIQIPVILDNPAQLFEYVTINGDSETIGWVTVGNRNYSSTATTWDYKTKRIRDTRTYTADPMVSKAPFLFVSALLLVQPTPLVFRSDNQVLELHQLTDDKLLYRIDLQYTETPPCIISPDTTLVSLNAPRFITIRRVADGQLLRRLPTRRQPLFWESQSWYNTAAFSADNRYLLAASYTLGGSSLGIFPPPPADEPAVLWDLAAGQIVQRFEVTPDGAQIVAYSPDGQYVATAGRTSTGEGEIRVFRVQPQLPYLQPLSLALGMLLLALVVLPWLWLRR